jgi:hypothetical protein
MHRPSTPLAFCDGSNPLDNVSPNSGAKRPSSAVMWVIVVMGKGVTGGQVEWSDES